MRVLDDVPPAWRWGMVVLCLLMAALTFVVMPVSETLSCEATHEGYACVHADNLRFDTRRSEFTSASVGSIEYVEYSSGKGRRKTMGHIEIFDRKGAPLSAFALTRTQSRVRYEALRDFVDAANAGEHPEPLALEHHPFSRGLALPIVLAAMAGYLLYGLLFGNREANSIRGQSPSAVEHEATTRGRWSTSRVSWGAAIAVVGATAIIGALMTSGESRNLSSAAAVEVRCTHRCKVNGMDCRPPGVIVDAQPPGTYTVQVYDPNAPTGWTDLSIEVEAGERYVLECVPPE